MLSCLAYVALFISAQASEPTSLMSLAFTVQLCRLCEHYFVAETTIAEYALRNGTHQVNRWDFFFGSPNRFIIPIVADAISNNLSI